MLLLFPEAARFSRLPHSFMSHSGGCGSSYRPRHHPQPRRHAARPRRVDTPSRPAARPNLPEHAIEIVFRAGHPRSAPSCAPSVRCVGPAIPRRSFRVGSADARLRAAARRQRLAKILARASTPRPGDDACGLTPGRSAAAAERGAFAAIARRIGVDRSTGGGVGPSSEGVMNPALGPRRPIRRPLLATRLRFGGPAGRGVGHFPHCRPKD